MMMAMKNLWKITPDADIWKKDLVKLGTDKKQCSDNQYKCNVS